MKLSSLIMIFAAVDARKVETGSRYAKKLDFLETKKEKKEEKAAAKEFQAMQRSLTISSGGRPKGERRQIRKESILNRQSGRQGRRDQRVANSSQPMEYGARVESRMDRIMMKKDELKDSKSERKQAKSDARKDAINDKQAARAENNQEDRAQVQAKQAARQEKQDNRQEKSRANKDAVIAKQDARQEKAAEIKAAVNDKQEARQEKSAENKEAVKEQQAARQEKQENRAEAVRANKDAVNAKQNGRQEKQDNRFSGIMQRRMVINQKQDARAERGPKENGQRKSARKEKQDVVKAANKQARQARQQAIQLKKTWNPCENGTVSNESLGPRKKGHMQKCMLAKEYQNDALRCIVYGMRAEHVDKACANICDAILASYTNLNSDMATCQFNKNN
jgi:myosin heavy subunit